MGAVIEAVIEAQIKPRIRLITNAEPSHSAIVTVLDEIWSLHRVYIH